ncbi:MAG TPA: helix-turn-helix domain-containing protein [Pyrinomonadaceae bacterium]
MENLLTTKEVAERLGISDTRVRQMILNKQLPAQKFGHAHMVKESDLELVRERKAGRPPKVKVEK